MDDNMDQLRRKLKWYILQATYVDYNEQEVEYILKKLKESDSELEKEINLSSITFFVQSTQIQTIQKNTKTNKKILYKISFIALAAASLIAIFMGHNAFAGKSNGSFYFIDKNKNSFSFYVYHEHKYNRYNSYEDIPAEWETLLWVPQEQELNGYELEYIRTKEYTELEYIIQYYTDTISDNFFEISYYFKEEYETPKYDLLEEYYHEDIWISCYHNISDKEQEYYYHFKLSGSDYVIRATNKDIGRYVLYQLIKFLK